MPGPAFIRGDAVTLRPIEEEDFEFLRRLVNDPEIRPMISVELPTTRRQQQDWYESTVATNEGDIHLMIEVDDDIVGTIWLHHESTGHPEAELTLFVEKESWGNGYGTEATELVVDYAFRELGKHRIEASVYETNEASMHLFEKLEFEHEAVHEECAFLDGEYVDVHVYRVLESEWEN